MLFIDQQIVAQSPVSDINTSADIVKELFEKKKIQQAVAAQEIPMYPNGLEGGGFYSLPAYIKDYGVAGIKWTTHVRNQSKPAADAATASYTKPVILLNSLTDGSPLALIDGHMISGLRTASVSYLCLSKLSCFHPRKVLCCGSGHQARWQAIAALNSLKSLEVLYIWSRNYEHAKACVSSLESYISKGVQVKAIAGWEDCIDNMDIVIGATSAEQCYLTKEHLKNSAYIHIGLNDISEEAIYSYKEIICDDFTAGTHKSQQSLFRLYRKNQEIENRVSLLENNLEKTFTEKRVMFSSFGLSIFDIGLAYHVYRYAQNQGLGEELDLY